MHKFLGNTQTNYSHCAGIIAIV